jgi:hypothetical protein
MEATARTALLPPRRTAAVRTTDCLAYTRIGKILERYGHNTSRTTVTSVEMGISPGIPNRHAASRQCSREQLDAARRSDRIRSTRLIGSNGGTWSGRSRVRFVPLGIVEDMVDHFAEVSKVITAGKGARRRGRYRSLRAQDSHHRVSSPPSQSRADTQLAPTPPHHRDWRRFIVAAALAGRSLTAALPAAWCATIRTSALHHQQDQTERYIIRARCCASISEEVKQ